MLQIFFSSHGDQAFGVLPKEIQERVMEKLKSLAQDPHWYRKVKKLRGTESRYRLRIGRWRILFNLRGSAIEIADIFLKKGRDDYRRRR